MNTATIFVHDSRLLRREQPNIGVRFDTQVLPSGSRAVGFLTHDSRTLNQPAAVADTDWAEAVRYAEDVLCDRWQSDSDYSAML